MDPRLRGDDEETHGSRTRLAAEADKAKAFTGMTRELIPVIANPTLWGVAIYTNNSQRMDPRLRGDDTPSPVIPDCRD